MQEAWLQHERGDTLNLWRTIYAVGFRCRGSRQRCFNVPDCYLPSLQEWGHTMVASAREGGFSAKVLQAPADAAAEELQRLEDEGLDYYAGAPASLARDDWFRTLDQLR
eukprot:6385445-Pyramimonas_sp.AAC.1